MSSECRCHTDEYCFYCEMYVPLEKKCEGLLFERDKAIDEMRHRTKKQREAHFKTESQLFLATKTLEQYASIPVASWAGDSLDIGKPAREILEAIKRISTEGVSP